MPRLGFFAHVNVFFYGGKPVPVEVALATIPLDHSPPQVFVINVDHSGFSTDYKDRKTNKWINRRIHLPLATAASVPIEMLECVLRAKYKALDKGERSVIGVKGLDQRNIFAALGLPAICYGAVPKFVDLPDREEPCNLHRNVHLHNNTTECSMMKAYRFAKYFQMRRLLPDLDSSSSEEEDGFSY